MGGRGASYWKKNGIDRQREDYSGGMPFDPKEFEDPESEYKDKEFKNLKAQGISTRASTDTINREMLNTQQMQINKIANEYAPYISELTENNEIQLGAKELLRETNGYSVSVQTDEGIKCRLVLSTKMLSDENLKSIVTANVASGWHSQINIEDNYKIRTSTHEMGHVVEFGLFEKMRKKDPLKYGSMTDKNLATEIRNEVKNACREKYNNDNVDVSAYGLTNSMEWFAETFTNLWLADKPTNAALELEEFIRRWD